MLIPGTRPSVSCLYTNQSEGSDFGAGSCIAFDPTGQIATNQVSKYVLDMIVQVYSSQPFRYCGGALSCKHGGAAAEVVRSDKSPCPQLTFNTSTARWCLSTSEWSSTITTSSTISTEGSNSIIDKYFVRNY